MHSFTNLKGGIGGLTVARILQKIGLSVHVFEKLSQHHPNGSGIGLWINALQVMKSIGLEDKLRSKGALMTSAGYRNPKGAWLARPTPLQLKRTSPCLCLHRNDLYNVLLDGINENVHWNSEFVDCENKSDSVIAKFADGKVVEGDLLIGC